LRIPAWVRCQVCPYCGADWVLMIRTLYKPPRYNPRFQTIGLVLKCRAGHRRIEY
jgi:hypothetical protein